MTNRTSERKAAAREHALSHIEKNGFGAATATRLAAASGISRRTFFRYFESREDVVAEGLDPIGATLIAIVFDRPPGERAQQAAAAALRTLAEHLPGNPDQIRRLLEITVATEAIRARLVTRQDRWRRDLTDTFTARGANPDDAAAVAAAAVAIIDTVLQLWRVSEARDASAEMALALAAVRWVAL